MQRLLCYQCGTLCDFDETKYPYPLCPPCAKVKIAARAAQRAAGKANRAAKSPRADTRPKGKNPRRMAKDKRFAAEARRKASEMNGASPIPPEADARLKAPNPKAAPLTPEEIARRKAQSERDRLAFKREQWAKRFQRPVCQKKRKAAKPIPGIIASPEGKPAEIVP